MVALVSLTYSLRKCEQASTVTNAHGSFSHAASHLHGVHLKHLKSPWWKLRWLQLTLYASLAFATFLLGPLALLALLPESEPCGDSTGPTWAPPFCPSYFCAPCSWPTGGLELLVFLRILGDLSCTSTSSSIATTSLLSSSSISMATGEGEGEGVGVTGEVAWDVGAALPGGLFAGAACKACTSGKRPGGRGPNRYLLRGCKYPGNGAGVSCRLKSCPGVPFCIAMEWNCWTICICIWTTIWRNLTCICSCICSWGRFGPGAIIWDAFALGACGRGGTCLGTGFGCGHHPPLLPLQPPGGPLLPPMAGNCPWAKRI